MQGVQTGCVTTLGRGGSDLTATAIGRALGLREIQVSYPIVGITCYFQLYATIFLLPMSGFRVPWLTT